MCESNVPHVKSTLSFVVTNVPSLKRPACVWIQSVYSTKPFHPNSNMKTSVFIGISAALICILDTLHALPDVAELVDSIEKEMVSENIEGHSHVISKRRATPESRMMEARNELLKRSVDKLSELDNIIAKEEAVIFVKRELSRRGGRGSQGSRRPGGFGGHGNKLPTRPTIDDACNNAVPTCDATYMYRNVTGTCNNIENPFYGSANIGMRRYLAAKYVDDINMPVGGYPETQNIFFHIESQNRKKRSPKRQQGGGNSGNGKERVMLPVPRVVSIKFHADVEMPSAHVTHMVTQMGQFLDHDITLTPENHVEECCEDPEQAECLPLHLPLDDPFYATLSTSQTCLEFTRSVAYCEDPTKPREQMNGITAFMDCSNVYGSDEETSNLLRSNVDGKLLVNSDSAYGEKDMLPEIDGLLQAGDVRAIEMPGLATMHTLFLREHNRLAEAIHTTSSQSLSDEDIYQTARRIMIAEWQNIIYSEYLPVVLGDKAMKDYKNELPSNFGSFSSYNDKTDPSITNSFATAAYRFGHSMIQGLIQMMSTTTFETTDEYLLRDHYFNLNNYLLNGGEGMEQILVGLINQPAQDMDNFVTEDVTNFLFPEEGHNFGSDLVARNIQRGRDHGLPGYNSWRSFCNLKTIESMKDKPKEISSKNWNVLKNLYKSPEDIDLFTAGLAETPVNDGLTGATFNCIKAKQFKSLKDGDRFFFTHQNQAGSFTSGQLKQLRGRQLRDVICENTGISATRDNVFLLDGDMKDCSAINQLDMTLFV